MTRSFKELAGGAVFTYFCIEQIPYAVEAVVENIIRAAPARVVNIEPAVDMLRLSQPRDFASRSLYRVDGLSDPSVQAAGYAG